MSDLNIFPNLLKIFSKKQPITDPAVSPAPSQLRSSQYFKLAFSNPHDCIYTFILYICIHDMHVLNLVYAASYHTYILFSSFYVLKIFHADT